MQPPTLSMHLRTHDAQGRAQLTVLAKRTYALGAGGRCEPADAQEPLALEPQVYPGVGPRDNEPLRWDSDLYNPFKPGTDLVVQGAAHSTRGPVRELDVSVAVRTPGGGAAELERATRRLRITGERRVERRGPGNTLAFGAPEAFTSMPVRYDRAYGGRDLWAERNLPDELAALFGKRGMFLTEDSSPFIYPRNPSGRGYLLAPDPEALEALRLPNVEDPRDLLTPERLCTGELDRWGRAPVPGGFDWRDLSWFPRVGFFGFRPPVDCAVDELPEVRAGFLAADLLVHELDDLADPDVPRPTPPAALWHGASPGLAFAPFTGHESVVLTGMHPAHERLEVVLPRERPRLLVELPGGAAAEATPRLGTVVIRPDEDRLIWVWCGSVPLDHAASDADLARLRHAVEWRPA